MNEKGKIHFARSVFTVNYRRLIIIIIIRRIFIALQKKELIEIKE